jgi:hypothetical protein
MTDLVPESYAAAAENIETEEPRYAEEIGSQTFVGRSRKRRREKFEPFPAAEPRPKRISLSPWAS